MRLLIINNILKKFLPLTILFAVLSFFCVSEVKADADYSFNSYTFYRDMVNEGKISRGADSYAVALDENIYFGGYTQINSMATIRYSTIGLRVHFGDYAQWYVDIPCDYARCCYNGEVISYKLSADINNSIAYLTEMQVNSRAYSLFRLDYYVLQRRICDCYGAGSEQAQWIAPKQSENISKTLYIDHILTRSVIYNGNLYPDCGRAHIYNGYYEGFMGVYYDNDDAACATFGGFRDYYFDTTGIWQEDDFRNMYYNIPLTLTIEPTDGLLYKQNVYYRKKDYGSGEYSNFKSYEIGGRANPSIFYAAPGSYFTPSYLPENPEGYKCEKISPGYKLIDQAIDGVNNYYVDYTPVSFKVRFNSNGATSGSMGEQIMYYNYDEPLNPNQYKKEYRLSFDYMGGSGSVKILTSSYIFDDWNEDPNGESYCYSDEEEVINLCNTEGGVCNLYPMWYGGEVTLPTAQRPHYSFAGWTKDSETAKNANSFDECPTTEFHENQIYIPEKNENFYAVWYSDKPKISASKFVSNEADELTKEELLKEVRAEDKEDGDISSRIKIVDYGGLNLNKPKAGNYIITYSVKDYSGKEATFERELEILNLPPEITCSDICFYNFGRAKINKEKLLKKLNAKAKDVYDGDLTGTIEIVEKSGLKYDDKSNWHKEYKIVLAVTDSNGEEVRKEAIVKIIYRFVHFKK